MKLHLASDSGVTVIENRFIDEYMPSANGEFVKLYLYLLRCAGTGREISVSSIADFFDHTEKDVQRALAYWEKLKLLRLLYAPDGTISDIELLGAQGSGRAARPLLSLQDFAETPAAETRILEARSREEISGRPEEALPKIRSLTSAQLNEMTGKENIRQLIFIGGQYKGRPLTNTEIRDIIWVSEDLHFSDDLVEYLLEYCASKEKAGPHYMEKVAFSWQQKGITTVASAKQDSAIYNKDYYTILRALGMASRTITPTDAEFMDRWLNEYMFSIDIILEACRRSVLQTQQPGLGYTDSILKSWHEAHVKTLDDVRVLDQEHSRQIKNEKMNGKRNTAAVSNRPAMRTRFGNIPQHEYDFAAMEAELGAQILTQTGKGNSGGTN